jgi:repressor LexA
MIDIHVQINTAPTARPLLAGFGFTWEIVSLGRIAAGLPIEAIEDHQRQELLSLLTAPGRSAFQICDDSLIELGIFCGDMLIVQSQQRAKDGDIVVALIDNEQVTINRIKFRSGNKIELLSDNPNTKNRLLSQSRVVIQARVIAQVRRYR